MRRMPFKPPIGGPSQGRPAKRKPPKKGRPIGGPGPIKPIAMAPVGLEEGARNYLKSIPARKRRAGANPAARNASVGLREAAERSALRK